MVQVGMAYCYPIQPPYFILSYEWILISFSQLYSGVKQKIGISLINQYAVPSDLTRTAKKSYIRSNHPYYLINKSS